MDRPITHGPLADIITTFLSEKRALGYKYVEHERLLRLLDRFLLEHELFVPELPRDLVSQWLAKTPHECVLTQASRANATRQLARFMEDRGLPAYVPPPTRTEIARSNFTPRILSRVEIRTLLATVDQLPSTWRSPRRHLVMPELFRVLYGCGLRVSEALKLTVADVDLDEGVLLIREAKFRKDRLVPVSLSLAERLRRYAGALDRSGDQGDAFFPKQDGSRYDKGTIYSTFRKMLHLAGISHGGRGQGPRLHDVRHTYAVHRLEQWYRQDVDLSAKLPILSSYLGHHSITGTQRYLRLRPSLFPEVAARVEAMVGHIMPGRDVP